MRRWIRRSWALAASLTLGAAFLMGSVSAAAPGTNRVSRVTTSPDTFSVSMPGGMSANGTRMAFESDADLLDENIIPEIPAIWLYDTTTRHFDRLTSLTDATGFATGSFGPVLSADGATVAFDSDLDILHPGVVLDQIEVWLFNTQSMKYTRVTTASEPLRDSQQPSLSADGTKIAFFSDSDFRNEGRPAGPFEIWLYDTHTLTYTRITSASHVSRNSLSPRLSADGRKLVFYSDSDFLGQGIPDNQNEIWLYDIATLKLTRVTTGTDSQRDSQHPSLNADGTRLAFESDADLLNQSLPDNVFEIWLYNAQTAAPSRITNASQASRDSRSAVISGDGSRIAFQSDSDFFGDGIEFGQLEIWLYPAYRAYLPVAMKNAP